MKMILTGSKALEYWGLNRRVPKDIDYFSMVNTSIGGYDLTVLDEERMELAQQHTNSEQVLSPNAIYTIKCSHLGWDNHWQKTKRDVLWLKSKGCELIPELYYNFKEYWKGTLGSNENLSLAKTKDEFFNDYVTKVYDHDYLHELVAYPNRPVYEGVLKEGEEVLVDKDKFDVLSFEDQVGMFREETTVIAIERWLVNPSSKVDSWVKAYLMALQKVIISLTKNWAQDFMIHNLEYLCKPDFTYFQKAIKELNMSENVDTKPLEDFWNDHKVVQVFGWDEFLFLLAQRDFFEIDRETADKHGYVHHMQSGGGEGGAEHCEAVFEVSGHLYKVEYSYMSHAGYDYEYIDRTLREVKPVQKTVTVYE